MSDAPRSGWPATKVSSWIRILISVSAPIVVFGPGLLDSLSEPPTDWLAKFAFVLVFWFGGPLIAYLALVRTMTGSIVIGVAVWLIVVLPLLATRNENMLDAGATLFIPFLGIPVAIIGGLIDRLAVRGRRSASSA